MTVLIGNFGLCAAVLAAIATLLVSVRAARVGSQDLRVAARRGIYILTAILTLCSAALMTAELQSDFHLEYVAKHTEVALPLGYKAAAFWAGQEGSLLLWGWLLAALSTVFVIVTRKQEGTEHVVAVGTLATVIGFFAALMLFAANPFHPLEMTPADGQGLNPMLQDPGMVAHPPMLFMGYAGFTIPFALLVGVLATGRTDRSWLVLARPWILVSWIFLGAGILLGAQWAYTELGWGGYWAWDPVENASLLPWLTGTALLHSSMGQRHRGMFKRWNAALAATTFILCIFGTYITRSGVVDSVHTFGQSLVGTFFGVFLTITVLTSLVLIALRWDALKPERKLEGIMSREGMFLLGNILLVAMTLVTLVGTMFPVLTRPLMGQPMSVRQSFYNHGVLPLALILIALMGLATLLSYGRDAMKKVRNGLVLPLASATAVVGGLWILGIHSPWALACGVVGAVLAGSIAVDIYRGVRSRTKNTGENALAAVLKLLDSNHRRYGAHVVHVGIVMIAAGIAGSSFYNTKQLVPLGAGESVDVGRYHLTLNSLDEVRQTNYTAVQGNVSVTDASGNVETIQPQRRFYDKSEEASTQIALRSNWREDLYVTLAGWESGGKVVTLQIIINPLVRWIWAGGVALVGGAIFCLLPKFGRKPALAAAAKPAVATPRRRKVAAAH